MSTTTQPRYVYLAGPIMNCTASEANDWRRYVAEKLQPHNIIGVSPLRCEPLIGERYDLSYPDKRFGVPKAIAAKNRFDVRSCDMGLFYIPAPQWTDEEIKEAAESILEKGVYELICRKDMAEAAFRLGIETATKLKPKFHSFGTLGELFWSDGYGKQTIVVSDDPFIHRHPVISAAADWQLDTLEEAIDVIVGVLGAYSGGKNV